MTSWRTGTGQVMSIELDGDGAPAESEPADSAQPELAASGQDEEELVAGRLHPSSVFLKLGRSVVRNLWVFAVILLQGLCGDGGALLHALSWLLTLALVGTVMLAMSLVEYLTFRYRLTDRFLYIRRGYLRRLERRIPTDRIQDLTAEEGLVRRMFGVVRVAVQTSSTAGAEAKLDSIRPQDLETLRQTLERAQAASSPDVIDSEPPRELCFVSTQELIWLGLTDSRAGLILLIAGGAAQQLSDAADLEIIRSVIAWAGQLFGALRQQSTGSVVVVAVLLALLLWGAGLSASVVVNVLWFHGFTLTDADGTLRRRYGLLTRMEHALPRRRIQALWIRQSLLRRLFGLAVLKIHSMGTAVDRTAARRSGADVFIPVGNRGQLEALVRRIMPELDHRGLKWHPISRRIVRRYFVRGVVLAVVLMGGLLPTVGLGALAAIGLPLVTAAVGAAIYRTLRWAVRDGMLAVRSGVLGRQLALVPLHRVQCVTVVSNPLERLQNLAKLHVVLGGGATVSIPCLSGVQARELQRRIMRTTSSQCHEGREQKVPFRRAAAPGRAHAAGVSRPASRLVDRATARPVPDQGPDRRGGHRRGLSRRRPASRTRGGSHTAEREEPT
jgi:putative membrane protein